MAGTVVLIHPDDLPSVKRTCALACMNLSYRPLAGRSFPRKHGRRWRKRGRHPYTWRGAASIPSMLEAPQYAIRNTQYEKPPVRTIGRTEVCHPAYRYQGRRRRLRIIAAMMVMCKVQVQAQAGQRLFPSAHARQHSSSIRRCKVEKSLLPWVPRDLRLIAGT